MRLRVGPPGAVAPHHRRRQLQRRRAVIRKQTVRVRQRQRPALAVLPDVAFDAAHDAGRDEPLRRRCGNHASRQIGARRSVQCRGLGIVRIFDVCILLPTRERDEVVALGHQACNALRLVDDAPKAGRIELRRRSAAGSRTEDAAHDELVRLRRHVLMNAVVREACERIHAAAQRHFTRIRTRLRQGGLAQRLGTIAVNHW